MDEERTLWAEKHKSSVQQTYLRTMKLVNPEDMHKPKTIKGGRLGPQIGIPRLNKIQEPILGGDTVARMYGTRQAFID